MKILKSFWNKILLFSTLFLLAFIPLYPKLPLVNVTNTWVYIRFDDIAVLLALSAWIFLVITQRVKLKTPLTVSMLVFWVIGAVSTFHGVLILFPMLSNVFSNVAFLSFIRRIEYMSLFFVAYSSMKDKNYISYVIWVLFFTLLAVVGYGFGQKLLGFPAFLTMNEEFAKGVPIHLSELSRIPSTFGGQYDLAAYLVLVVPIIASMFFGFKNKIIKLALAFAALSGFGLLFATVSRVSFFAILISLTLLLIFQKKKWIILSLAALAVAFLILSPSLLKRFNSTVTPVNVLVDAATGGAIGEIKQVDKTYFKDKLILTKGAQISASKSAMLEYKDVPDNPQILLRPNVPNGESLPQGTGYVNLPLSPVLLNINEYFIENINPQASSQSAAAYVTYGKYLVKRARAYDLSFTTRFQGEWPNTFLAFERNVFFGSGYGSVSLAVDNDYLRILGETGILGFLSFVSIFALAGLYIKKTFAKVDSQVVKSFVLGFVAGTIGLAVNGALIDVFEASKVAFTYWLLMGVCIGVLHLYSRETSVNFLRDLKRIATAPISIILYILISTAAVFSGALNYYFVGDDFTWLHWAAQTTSIKDIANYFVNANGFFYRPGTMAYFYFMFQSFWLNQTFYHIVSMSLHFIVCALLFIVLLKTLKNYMLAIMSTFIFLILSGHQETILWIASTGFLFNAVFTLLALLLFIFWKEKQKGIYLVLSLLSIVLGLLFHEIGVIAPLLLISYDLIFWVPSISVKSLLNKTYLILLSPLLPYLALRLIAKSHWFNGDYSYNLIKLPFNFIGNAIGYFLLDLFGTFSIDFYEKIRNILKDNIAISVLLIAVIMVAFYIFLAKVYKKIEVKDKKIIFFGLAFFIISLLPFLGLGNIASRYAYLSSIGFAVLLALAIQKAYGYLVKISDIYVSALSMVIIVIILLSSQLFQMQKSHADWYLAGKISQQSLVYFQNTYDPEFEAMGTLHFYFVNVPIKTGDAWIFPVGLKDALWFASKDKDFTLDTEPDLGTALNFAKDVPNSQIFVMDKNGRIINYISDVPYYIRHLK